MESNGRWAMGQGVCQVVPTFRFYWYKNMSLFRHKATPPQVLAECENVQERLVAYCAGMWMVS